MAPISQAVLDGLNTGIQAEIAAYVFYMKGRNFSKDEKLKELLGILAAEEKDHYRILERQYDSLVRSELWVAYNDILRQPGLPEIEEKMEGIHNEYIERINKQTSARQILEMALKLEERARDIYADLAQKADDSKGRDMFEYLSKFENGHVIKIKRMLKDLKS